MMRQRFGSSAAGRFRQNYSQQDIFERFRHPADFRRNGHDPSGLRGFDEIFKEFYGQGGRSFRFDQQGLSGRGFFVFGWVWPAGPAGAAPFWPGTSGASPGPCWKKPAAWNCP